MTDLSIMDATAQAELVRTGEATPLELVEAAIERIERVNPELNAVIHRRFERALAEAAAELPDGPFRGVPFLVKDALCVTEGDPFHAGMRFLKERGYVADHDSWLAQRYRQAGFVFVGKTNTPELAASTTTEPLAYGPTRNPWDPRRSTAGSSGGSAAAVASGLVSAAHANDMGGSIRMPASFCGLVGLKPSYARTTLGPDFGEYWGQMTHEHVLTRSVRDSAAILDASAGLGPGDPYTAPSPSRAWALEVGADAGRLRIGIRTDMPGEGPPDAECVAAARATATLLEQLGHHVELTGPGALDDAGVGEHWLVVFCVHLASELDRIGGLFETKITADDVEPGTWALAEAGRGFTGLQLVAAHAQMHAYSREMASWWEDHDLLVTPQSGITPPELGALHDDLGLQARCAAFTLPFNVTGQPAISLPLHWTDPSDDVPLLPVGVQLVAAYGREDVLFRVSAQLEEARPWRDARPMVHA